MPTGGNRPQQARVHAGDVVEVLVGGQWVAAQLHAWSGDGAARLGHVEYQSEGGPPVLDRVPLDLIRDASGSGAPSEVP